MNFSHYINAYFRWSAKYSSGRCKDFGQDCPKSLHMNKAN